MALMPIINYLLVILGHPEAILPQPYEIELTKSQLRHYRIWMENSSYVAWKKYIEAKDLTTDAYMLMPDDLWNFNKVIYKVLFILKICN